MNARARRIRAAAEGSWTPPQVALLDAVAAMLDAATAKGKGTASALAEGVPLPVPVATVFEAIKATGKVLCEPIDKRWFGRLGRTLQSVRIEPGTLEVLCAWLEAGGLNWWTVPATFDHVFTNLAKWAASATEWDSRGRQALGAKGGVGSAQSAAPTDWSAFNRKLD